MSQKQLVTQGEVKNTISGLDALANNLNDHVNASMSKSHGWTGMDQEYFDSGGCWHTDTPGRVLRIVVGDQIYYAPAQLSGGLDGYPDPVLPPYTGIISPQQADPTLDLTVGSPAIASLVTEFAGELNVVAGASDTTLLSHAGTEPERVHGALSGMLRYTRDNAGARHIVGRRVVNLTIAGVKWSIVCDYEPLGPTQPTRFVNTCPQIIAKIGESNLSDQGNCYWKDEAGDGDSMNDYVAELEVVGTPPIQYKWQYCTNATTPIWTDVVSGGTYSVNNGFSFTVLADAAHAGDEWIVGLPSGATTVNPPASTKLRIAISHGGSNANGTNFGYGIRMVADNSAIPDGSIIYSDMLSMAMIDHTGCC
jgi:hypothetical protein